MLRPGLQRFLVVWLPTLPCSQFPAFVDWKGSVSVDVFHAVELVKDKGAVDVVDHAGANRIQRDII